MYLLQEAIHWRDRKMTRRPFSRAPPRCWEGWQGRIQTSSPTLKKPSTTIIAQWRHGKPQKSGTKVHFSNRYPQSPRYKRTFLIELIYFLFINFPPKQHHSFFRNYCHPCIVKLQLLSLPSSCASWLKKVSLLAKHWIVPLRSGKLCCFLGRILIKFLHFSSFSSSFSNPGLYSWGL